MKVVAVLCLLAAAAVQVHAFPNGAPSGACPNIFPVGHTNPSNSVIAPTGGPFQLDVSNFTMCTGAVSAPGYCYYPGETYYREFMDCVDDTWVLQCCSFFMHEVCYYASQCPSKLYSDIFSNPRLQKSKRGDRKSCPTLRERKDDSS